MFTAYPVSSSCFPECRLQQGREICFVPQGIPSSRAVLGALSDAQLSIELVTWNIKISTVDYDFLGTELIMKEKSWGFYKAGITRTNANAILLSGDWSKAEPE